MRKGIRNTILLSILIITLVSSYAQVASAYSWQWWKNPRIFWCTHSSNDYCLTSNFEGIDEIPLNANVEVVAATNDRRIDKVKFIWINPDNEELPPETVPVEEAMDTDGTPLCHKTANVIQATSEHILNKDGIWRVKAYFIDQFGVCWFNFERVIAKRCISLFVVPEVPLLGSVGASTAMLLSVLAYKAKKKQKIKK